MIKAFTYIVELCSVSQPKAAAESNAPKKTERNFKLNIPQQGKENYKASDKGASARTAISEDDDGENQFPETKPRMITRRPLTERKQSLQIVKERNIELADIYLEKRRSHPRSRLIDIPYGTEKEMKSVFY